MLFLDDEGLDPHGSFVQKVSQDFLMIGSIGSLYGGFVQQLEKNTRISMVFSSSRSIEASNKELEEGNGESNGLKNWFLI